MRVVEGTTERQSGPYSPKGTQRFGTADVARLLGVQPVRVRAIVRAGLCQPSRRGRAFQFSFQDLVTLRAAQALLQAEVPPRRIRTALREIERQLPPGRPLSAVRLYADGRRVLVRSQGRAWNPESGQAVFSFNPHSGKRDAGVVVPVEKRHGRAAAVYWFTRGLTLEGEDITAACTAYRQALELNPDLADAYLNLGRLVHETGDTTEAIRLYREAVRRIPDDPVAHYNLATALEDTNNLRGAVRHYHAAVDIDPEFADAHYNLGRLLERIGQRKRALRHFLAYRRLTHP